MRKRPSIAVAAAVLVALVGVAVPAGAQEAGTAGTGATGAAVSAGVPPYRDPGLPVRRRVADLLGRTTLEEKIGQMTQAERGAVIDDPTRIADWHLGSVLSGGGSTPATNTPEAWV